MAKIAFVTLYDQFSVGIRLMARILLDAGHGARVIYFKLPRESAKTRPHDSPLGYEIVGGEHLLAGCVQDDPPWTDLEVELLIQHLSGDPPDMVGLSTRSLFDRFSPGLLRRVRQALPNTVLVAGGFGPMLNPQVYLQAADFVVFGEGEEAIMQMADALDEHGSLEAVPNLIFQEDGHLVRNPVKTIQSDLDVHPDPHVPSDRVWTIEDDRLVPHDPAAPENVVEHPVMAGRGCIGGCTYCSAGQWTALYRARGCRMAPRRLRSVGRTLDEIRCLAAKGYKRFCFLDSFLVAPRAFLLELFEGYGREIGLPFSANFYPVQIDRHPEVLDLACEAGLERAVLGIQHGSERFRRTYFNRRIPNDLLLRVAEQYRRSGVETEYHLISGIPFESEEDFEDSLAFAARLPMERGNLLVFRLQVFPQSPLEEMIRRQGLPSKADPGQWLLRGLTYFLRGLFPDPHFQEVRYRVHRAFVEGTGNGSYAVDVSRALVPLISRELLRRRITSFGPAQLIRRVYRDCLFDLQSGPVIVWGAGEGLRRWWDLFRDTAIEAVIDADPSKQGQTIAGAPVLPPSHLETRNLPVFICSHYKKEICAHIKRDYPHISLIP